MRQRFVCGLGLIDFKKVIYNNSETASLVNSYINGAALFGDQYVGKLVAVAGLIASVKVRSSKNGPFAEIELSNDTETIWLTIWNECWSECEYLFQEIEEKICIFTGIVTWNAFKKANVIYSHKTSKVFIV
jgi:DNA polymerase III alpha subunit